MSTIRYLVDYKNKRAFCLGDRYYSEGFNRQIGAEHRDPFSEMAR